MVVPKKAGDFFLVKKLSSHAGFESYLALKDDKKIIAKVSTSNPDLAPSVIDGSGGSLDFDPGFRLTEKPIEAEVKKEPVSEVKKSPVKSNAGSKNKPATKPKAKAPAVKAKKAAIKPQPVKAVRVKRKRKSNNSQFIILGAVVAIFIVAFIALSGSSVTNVEVNEVESADSTNKDRKTERKRQKELEKKQALARQEEERRLELEKEAELARQEEAKRKAELEKKQELARQAAEKEKEQELSQFLAVINPPQEKLDLFKTLPAVSAANLKSLMNKHCVECHNAKKNKGDLNLDVFNNQLSIYRGYEIIKHAYESVSFGDMPPDEDDISQEDKSKLIGFLEKLIYTLESKPANMNKTALIRRLTPYEYDNTITDITELDLKIGDSFPADGSGNQGFSNDAYVMGISPILMEKYIEAAETISSYSVFDINEGIGFSKSEESAPAADVFESDLRKEIYASSRKVYPGTFSVEGALPKLMKAVSEIYHKTSNKEALETIAKRHRLHASFVQKGYKYFSSSAGKSDIEHKALSKWKSLRRGKVEDADLNEAIKEFSEFYKNSNFFLTNRSHKDRKKHVSLVKNVESFFYLDDKSAAAELQGSRLTDYKKIQSFYEFSRFATSVREGKEVYSHISPIIQKFLFKVYRRPPMEQELAIRTKDFMEDSLLYGMPVAARILVIRELSSLNFAFRIESKKSSLIDDYDLASRLSYFLWAGPPDDELLRLASEGKLKDEEVLLGQVDRMLKDKKSARLAKHFASQWLGFGDILENEGPSSELFTGFDKELAKDMWQETAMCFNYIVKNDRSLLELIDADYTIVNNKLSRIYGLNQSSSSFKKVSVDPSRRGGILGHASFLTMTSLSQRTSPIIRGNWILTTLLGEYVPPAPMNVPALPEEEVVNESLTLEQQLAKHRNVAACRGCHKKIDPLGVVLENYDPVGRWRQQYKSAEIVSEAKINGAAINGLAGLKKYLLNNKVQFTRNLSKKIVSYGLGRSTYFYDNFLINNMIENAIRNDYKFSSLVKTFVLSPQFQHK